MSEQVAVKQTAPPAPRFTSAQRGLIQRQAGCT
jgi:hypothetical protein